MYAIFRGRTMARIVSRGIVHFVCAVTLGVSMEAALASQEQWHEVRLFIKDERGSEIPNATVTVSGQWTEEAERGGMVRIEWRPGLSFPFVIEVRAPGFFPGYHVIEGAQRNNTTICLQRRDGE